MHSIGIVATSIFAGMVILRTDGDAFYLLGWDPANTIGSGQRQVSGLSNCLNERASPGTSGPALRCHPPGTSIPTTNSVAWVDGYLWLETDTGNCMAARWLCLEIHCPYGTVPDTTWIFGH